VRVRLADRASLGLLLFLATVCAEPALAQPKGQVPFFDARRHKTEYAGPGRDTPPPAEVAEVRIGYFAPGDPSDPDAGDMWRAAQLAVAHANAQRGLAGKPFRLVPAGRRTLGTQRSSS